MQASPSITTAGSLGIAYPERGSDREPWYEARARELLGTIKRPLRSRAARYRSIVSWVEMHAEGLDAVSDAGLRERALDVGQRMRRRGFGEELVGEVFALIREVAGRCLGQRHYDVQLIGGWVLLGGMVAEMETGEGKTLTATLAATAAALAGLPVHVITSNDYLATRDAEAMRPIYAALGLDVGIIQNGMEPSQRQKAYGCHITYCSNKEIAFDYLRDRITLGKRHRRLSVKIERVCSPEAPVNRLLLRGLFFGIVDEADSVLVDEARTPLIISEGGRDSQSSALYNQAVAMARGLEPGRDYHLDDTERKVEISAGGLDRLENLAANLEGIWQGPRRREQLVTQALSALHLYRRDVHYLVRDEKAQIIDEYTGRVLPDRSWEHGLHQMVEAKEGVPITERRESLARTSYQRFFRRYLHLAGMTGTAWEIAPELWSVYSLDVVRVPTNRTVCRHRHGTRVFSTEAKKWQAAAERVAAYNSQGRPVLVGTRSVAASESLSDVLTLRGIGHRVLNANQDQEEAQVISSAGLAGAVTVATNMAGRGTDIKLDQGVAEAGGLHVLATEIHDARRIDRQLYGRCGRQGDPGSYEMLLSLEDELIVRYLPLYLRNISLRLLTVPGTGPVVRGLLSLAQRRAQRQHFRIRKRLLKLDERLEDSLAFSGSSRWSG